ncbi:DUF6731 family protein [Flagellimonas baculiformis]|uniref:DUF6731 family protein n=1 Tax=Flagellimonas baculiformis TaxID=3067310 RepID=UPI00296F5F87|nr:DUF6731 family protein [Muricauda sp. D6]
MALKKKKIEFYKVSMKTFNGEKESQLKFEDILKSSDINGQEVIFKGKDMEMKIFDKKPNLIVGLLETSRRNNVPPKKNKTAKSLSKIGLNKDEGLAYANVFLYDVDRQILMYEINKFGSYLDHFVSYIYLALKQSNSTLFKKFKINLEVVLTSNEYNRILNMKFHKSVEIQIAYPNKIIEDLKHQNGALSQVCKSANKLNSSKLHAKFEVDAKNKKTSKGLTSKTVKEFLDDAKNLLKTKSNQNVQKVIVSGYGNDLKKLQHLDLIANRYIKHISIDEPRENSNLLELQRSSKIKELHENCKQDLDSIFS